MKKSVKNVKINMIKNIIVIIFSMIILAIAFNLNTVYAKNTGKINTPNVVLRQEPNTTSNKLGFMYKTDVVDVLEESGEWYKIVFDGKTGYTKKEFVDVEDNGKIKKQEKPETEKTGKTENQKINENKKEEIEEGQDENDPNKANNKKNDEKAEVQNSEEGAEGSSKEKNKGTAETKKIAKDVALRNYPVIYSIETEKVASGKEVEIMSVRGKWTKITVDGHVGWIPNNVLEQKQD